MKLASLKNGTKDGALMVVDRALTRMIAATDIAHTMRDALDRWDEAVPALQQLSDILNRGEGSGSVPYAADRLMAPLPRAFGWIDGSAYLSHMQRARALRGAAMPDDFSEEPLMSERVSVFLGGRDPIPLPKGDIGLDIEGEIGVILDDVPAGTDAAAARSHIKLFTLINDVSLRTVLADTIARGRSATLFAKPFPAMGPVAVTPDELGNAWDGQLLKRPLVCHLNGKLLASPHGGTDASFNFPQLVSYCASYKPLPCTTVLASGTVSNYDDTVGGACIAERRLIEQKIYGAPLTPYLQSGDVIRIEMLDAKGNSIFDAIEQIVT